MPNDDSEYPFEGLSVSLPGLMPDGGAERMEKCENGFVEDEEIPTSPENPTAKRLALAERICSHGLKIRDCSECLLLLEHGGRYSVIEPRGDDD
ncbi:MAG: hypothetical protein RDU25_01650 [Patescibacteria group bacterium]|nr:hypothetical protein [Patescibacteria group bacterium]